MEVTVGVTVMAKSDLFEKLKSKLHRSSSAEEKCESENEGEITETNEKTANESVATYHETLYSKDSTEFKKQSSVHEPARPLFRDMDGIEKKIDSLSSHRMKSSESPIGKKVDQVLSGKKSAKTRKLPNVIYVVSKPQPGQVKGDWAVRSHRKIFSYHRTKKAAINAARKVAMSREATVLVQNTDGTFSSGFKPRKKKS